MKYFTSDHHFWHANIIKLCNRPFYSVEEMNDTMVRRWNNTVQPEDEVYCLGDFSLAYRPVEYYTPLLNGKKFLVPGNHDFCHTFNKQSRIEAGHQKWLKKYEECGWTILPEKTSISIPEIGEINLCHLPYGNLNSDERIDEMPDKYEKWRPEDNGNWLLCGHVHNRWKYTWDFPKNKKKMINVGVDVWGYRPVSINKILTSIWTMRKILPPFLDKSQNNLL